MEMYRYLREDEAELTEMMMTLRDRGIAGDRVGALTTTTATPDFEQLVRECGLSSMFSGHAMARAIARSGVSPETMTVADLERALPEVERTLAVFLDAHELLAVSARLHRLARTAATTSRDSNLRDSAAPACRGAVLARALDPRPQHEGLGDR